MFADDNKYIKISGFFLLEIMLSIVLGMLVLSVVLEIFLASQRSYQMQLALRRLENHAKAATNFLITDIQKAGHIGCARLTPDFPLYATLNYNITPTNKLTGFHAEELTVRYINLPSVTLTATMKDAYTLHTTSEEKFKANAILIISDCQQAEIFQVKSSSVGYGLQTIVPNKALHKIFSHPAEVGPLVIHRYFVDKTKHKNPDGSWKYALFLVDELRKTKTELVEGVNAMHVFFTAKKAGKIVTFPASENSNGGNVLGVAIDLDLVEPPLKKVWHIYVSLHEK